MKRSLSVIAALSALLAGCRAPDSATSNRHLLDSVKKGDVVQARNLLKSGAAIEARQESGRTPLMLAALHSNDAMVEMLVIEGADVNARDKSRMTALMWAAFGGSEKCVQALLRAGANVDDKDGSGKTAMDWIPPGKEELRRILKGHTP